ARPVRSARPHGLTYSRYAFQRRADRFGRCDPPQESLHVIERRILNEGWPRLLRRVGGQDAEELAVIGLADRRLDADIGGDADEYEMTNVAGAQNVVQRGSAEPAVARFGDDDIAGRWLEFIDELVVPAAVREDLSLELRPRPHDLQRIRLVPVR